MGKETNRAISSNKKAFHNYTISEKYEAGIVLEGCEVKSIRNGKITLQESYARFFGEELWLVGCHITPYFAATHDPPDPLRNRKLLLHKAEIKKLIGKINEKGFSLIPLSVYFSKNRVKISLGLGKSKKLHDKRQVLKERSIKKEIDKSLKTRY